MWEPRFAESRGLGMGNVVNPLRVAVTGQGVGPGLYDCLAILGRETCRKPTSKRKRLLVSEPAEHDMRHQRELTLDCLADIGVVVAVAGGPPRGNPVDQLAPIAEHDAGAMRARHGQRRSRRLHLRIGQPDVSEPGLIPRRP